MCILEGPLDPLLSATMFHLLIISILEPVRSIYIGWLAVAIWFTMVSGRLNVVKGLKQKNQIVSFERTQHMIRLETILVKIYLAKDHSRTEIVIGALDWRTIV
jgi:hypothetical protein